MLAFGMPGTEKNSRDVPNPGMGAGSQRGVLSVCHPGVGSPGIQDMLASRDLGGPRMLLPSDNFDLP